MGRALVWCVVFFGCNSSTDNKWRVAPVGDRRAPRYPVTLPTPLSVVQLHLYIRPVSVYFGSLLYPPRSCPRAPNTLSCDSRLVRLRLSQVMGPGYGPRPWPLPAAASNFPPRATPYPEALV
ncbi:hypothetical protein K438DRAFT_1841077, partial [Mycena galopus ATCC 62051]